MHTVCLEALVVLVSVFCTTDATSVTYSDDLDPELLPCRAWVFPCGEPEYTCTSTMEYYSFLFGPQPFCPALNSTAPPPPGACILINGTCAFSEEEEPPTCVSWVPDCTYAYSCTTEEEYQTSQTEEHNCFPSFPPPPSDNICVPQDDTCVTFDPCQVWQQWCNGVYSCGNVTEYTRFLWGPQPLCYPYPASRPEPTQPGECVYQEGTCEWSECRSWLSPCRTSWNCGSDYEYRVSQALPLPPCAAPPEGFEPPEEPGVCRLNTTSGQCQFYSNPCDALTCNLERGYECQIYEPTGEAYCAPNCELDPCEPGEVCRIDSVLCIRAPCPGVLTCSLNCTEGREWQDCGTACPLTCDNYGTIFPCTTECVSDCFCPSGTVDHEGDCIAPFDCPNYTDPCESITCDEEGYECQVYEPTGEGYCAPNCELDPCGPGEVCRIDSDFPCFRAPCPGVLTCSPNNCTGGRVWQDCGTACPHTCDNHGTIFPCTTECVSDCFCPSGTVDHEGECISPFDCPDNITPCALVLCAPGYTCEVHEPTNTAYCNPSCTFPHSSYWCRGRGRRCRLEEGNCTEPEEEEPCPNTVSCDVCRAWQWPCFEQPWRCTSYEEYQQFLRGPQPGCPVYDTPPNALPGQCTFFNESCQFISDETRVCRGGKEWRECGSACPPTCDTYVHDAVLPCTAQCVSGCFCPEGKVDNNGRCVDPSECPACEDCYRNPISVPCSDDNRLECDKTERCLTHSTTGQSFCLQSCYLDNGGCEDESDYCYYQYHDYTGEGENTCDYSGPCSKPTCATSYDKGLCPLGWEIGQCGAYCQQTCEDYLNDESFACIEICGPPDCVCPSGLVVFRDRCVDPMECYSLINDPPPLNPLPLPEKTALLQLTLIEVSTEEFNGADFTALVTALSAELGLEGVKVSLYAVMEEGDSLNVFLRVRGVSQSEATDMATAIMDRQSDFGVTVSSVTLINNDTQSTDGDGQKIDIGMVTGSTVLIIVFCTFVILTITFVLFVVLVVLKIRRDRRATDSEDDEDKMSYAKIAAEENHYEFS